MSGRKKTKYSNVENYLKKVKDVVAKKNESEILKVLSFGTFPQAYEIEKEIEDVEARTARELNKIQQPYSDLVQKITLSRLHEQNSNYDKAIKIFEDLLKYPFFNS
jgi:hypothetical protein